MFELGDEENMGRFGWGTRNREGQELVEMLRDGLAVAGTFFQKESHKITYRSGRHKTARPNGGAAKTAQEGEGLQRVGGRVGIYVITQHGRLSGPLEEVGVEEDNGIKEY